MPVGETGISFRELFSKKRQTRARRKNMYSMFGSVIAAISTPRGKGGIAVIRMSGEGSIPIGEKFIFPKSGKALSTVKSNYAALCEVRNADGSVLDEAVVTVFRAPHSFTGEDTVEISCHGGVLLSSRVLSRAFECGAVQAAAGEFTRRAFSSGKISLSQAEAVIGKIDAKTDSSLRLWDNAAQGKIKRETDAVYDEMGEVISSAYAAIDFPEEDLSPLSREEMRSRMENIEKRLSALASTYRTGHAICEGVNTVICGKPNTGKSTLLNLLCGSERAIVTDIAGTTRDVITESVAAGDILLRLCDTAGIRETGDAIEKIGVDRSLSAIENAELILAVFDGSAPLDDDDRKIISFIGEKAPANCDIIAVINKSDKGEAFSPEEIGFPQSLRLCAKDESSKAAITEAIEALYTDGGYTEEAVLTGERQYAAVCRALELTKSALAALDAFGEDIAGSELEQAMGAVGEIDGRSVGEDVVNRIFHNFCVGK